MRRAIEARRRIPLARFINALGIRYVGETNARLLARHYGSLDDWRAAMVAAAEGDPHPHEELVAINGIGPAVALHEGSTLLVVFNALRLLGHRESA